MDEMKWGDAVDNEEEVREFVQKRETPVDEHGIKTVIEYPEGGVKVVKKVKVRKVVTRKHEDVERRRQLKKFGEASGKPLGQVEAGVTMNADDVQIVSWLTKAEEEKEKGPAIGQPGIVCRTCGVIGDHWTPKCPFKDVLPAAPAEEAAATAGAARVEKYQAPIGRRQVDEPTVRVTNLSEETKESDVFDLFSPFGSVKRVFLAKDKQTGYSKGFAFVTYSRREDAARAIAKLQGYGYDHLILHLEWARPAGY